MAKKSKNLEKVFSFQEISEHFSEKLDDLMSLARQCFSSIDTTKIEEVYVGNDLVSKFNNLIADMNANFNSDIGLLKTFDLTDKNGNPITEEHIYIVGEKLVENDVKKYNFCRYVRARSDKEAVLKYKNVLSNCSNLICCLGYKETDDKEFAQYITDKNVIEG